MTVGVEVEVVLIVIKVPANWILAPERDNVLTVMGFHRANGRHGKEYVYIYIYIQHHIITS